jgi:hypothetical protein
VVEKAQPGVEFDDKGDPQEQFARRTGKEVGVNVSARLRKLFNLQHGPLASPPHEEDAERVPQLETAFALLDDFERRIKDGEFGKGFPTAGVKGVREALEGLRGALEKFEDGFEKLAPHVPEEEL